MINTENDVTDMEAFINFSNHLPLSYVDHEEKTGTRNERHIIAYLHYIICILKMIPQTLVFCILHHNNKSHELILLMKDITMINGST